VNPRSAAVTASPPPLLSATRRHHQAKAAADSGSDRTYPRAVGVGRGPPLLALRELQLVRRGMAAFQDGGPGIPR
jgi:hypothetical protein